MPQLAKTANTTHAHEVSGHELSASPHEERGRTRAAHEHTRHALMGHGHTWHDHSAMVADFRHRFWVSLVLTVPVLALSPLIQGLLGLQRTLTFPGDSYVLFGLSAIVFLYGGWPFLEGLVSEVSSRRPGMMTLIGVAITVAFVYSSAVVASRARFSSGSWSPSSTSCSLGTGSR